MKITKIKYTTNGPMGIKYHFTAIATEQGLEEALKYVEGKTITSQTEEEVESLNEPLGSAADHFTTYFMDGAKRVEGVKHYSTGTIFSVTYS